MSKGDRLRDVSDRARFEKEWDRIFAPQASDADPVNMTASACDCGARKGEPCRCGDACAG